VNWFKWFYLNLREPWFFIETYPDWYFREYFGDEHKYEFIDGKQVIWREWLREWWILYCGSRTQAPR
jgi:hypothetical protein